jgi:hypothetical protein
MNASFLKGLYIRSTSTVYAEYKDTFCKIQAFITYNCEGMKLNVKLNL